MPSQQLLPVTNRYFDSPTSSVSGSPPSMAAVLLKIEDDPSTGLYVSPSFDDDKNASMKPLLPRATSYTSISTTTTASNNNYQQRRRRINSDNSLPTLSSTRVGGRRESLGRDETAAEEAFVLTRLSLKLLRYLGNFPQGTISDMVNDASQGISFVCNHIAEYGGDPNRIYLMGQSAGAHIAACTLLEQAIKEAGEGERISWSISQIKAYFGLSGGKNFAETLKRAGVKAEAILYEGKTHTDLFLQDPMRGGSDQMFEDLIAIVHANDPDAIAKDATAPPRRRLVPEFLLKLAHNVSPF